MRVSLNTKVTRALARPVARVAQQHANWQLRGFMRSLGHCRGVQDRFLLDLVRANQDSDFGRRHGFGRIRGYADFTGAVPLARFAYYAPYIERCKDGDVTALFGPSQKVLMFAVTSGTAGTPKYIPITSRFMAAYHRGWNIWGVKNLADHPEAYLRKVLQITSPISAERTRGGFACGAISAALARRQKSIVRYLYVTPPEVAEIPDPDVRYYCTLRFALAEDVGSIVTANPSTLVALARMMDRDAPELIRDLYDGSCACSGDLPPFVRGRLLARMRPDRAASRRLQEVLERNGCLIPKHCWNPAVLSHWTGGTTGLYLSQVRAYYGDRAIRDIGLLASEGRMSIPLQDDTPAGVLDLFANFYEFVPQEELDESDLDNCSEILPAGLTVLRADQLEPGRSYFIFLSNHAGLYRYHIGDVVRVTGYVASAPVIEFLSRGAHTSSIAGEKLTEHQVVTAVNDVLGASQFDVTSFTVAPIWAEPPYYVLTIRGARPHGPCSLNQLADQIDERLGRLNVEYKSKRQSRRLDQLRICASAADPAARSETIRHEQHKHRFLISQPVDREDRSGSVAEGSVTR